MKMGFAALCGRKVRFKAPARVRWAGHREKADSESVPSSNARCVTRRAARSAYPPGMISMAVEEKTSSPLARCSNLSGWPGADAANQKVLTESPSVRV